MNRRSAIAVIGLVLAAACSRSTAPAASPAETLGATTDIVRLGSSDAANAGAGVAASGDKVVVTWAATAGDRTNVYAAVSADAGSSFDAPVRVNDVDGDARISGEQAPRVTFGRDLAVGWVSRPNGQSAIRIARSSDGRSFTPARSVNPSSLAGIRGWPSFTMSGDGNVHGAWLDTRVAARAAASAQQDHATHQAHHAAAAHAQPARQDVFHAVSSSSGSWAETTVATDVCFCCKTAVATAPDGAVFVAWRHVYPTNLRDIAIARSDDGGRTFAAPVRVSEDHWQIDACPEDGPSIVVTSDGVLHVVWPTMLQEGEPKKAVFYASSSDGGRTFTRRLQVDRAADGVHAAHPQIAAGGSRVFVTWDETTGSGYRVQLREVGSGRPAPPVTLSDDGSGSYPAIAVTPRSIVAAWARKAGGRSEIAVRRVLLK
jgi:hypothetical protein